MKSGEFAVYKGKEYRFVPKRNNEYLLLSSDLSDIASGFIDSFGNNRYTKAVKKSELDEIYRINVFGIYSGYKVAIRLEDNGNLVIEGVEYGQNESIMIGLGFYAIERGIYQKRVNKNDMTKIWEERTNL